MIDFMFVTPTQGEIRAETVRSVDDCRKYYGHHIEWGIITGGALLTKQFDYCVSMFLNDHTERYMVMLGSDMTFKPTDIEKLVEAAKSFNDEAVVDSLSFRENYKLCCNPIGNKLLVNGDIVEVESTGLGVSVIPRKLIWYVILELKLPELSLGTDISDERALRVSVWPIFQQAYDPDDPMKSYNGLDYTFCHRVRKAGCKVYVHTGVHVGHMKIKCINYKEATTRESG